MKTKLQATTLRSGGILKNRREEKKKKGRGEKEPKEEENMPKSLAGCQATGSQFIF